MTLRFAAGAMGVPFLPVRSGMETDIVAKWGFGSQMRRADPRLPDQKLCVIDNPFGQWAQASKLVLVPAINPDVTILHAQFADRAGTVRIHGLIFADAEQAKAARRVIVTWEELVDDDRLRENPEANQLPFFCVDAVVHLPMGAYPTACYGYYDYDPAYLNGYRDRARDETSYRDYLDRYIFGAVDHQTFLDLQDAGQLERIKADPRTGYAIGLDRK